MIEIYWECYHSSKVSFKKDGALNYWSDYKNSIKEIFSAICKDGLLMEYFIR